MNSNHVLIRFLAVLLAGLFIAMPSKADDHHPLHRDFYQTWKQPGTELSCCNARITEDGEEKGDCEPTKAEMRAGVWWAWLRQESRWIAIPESAEVRERNPNVFDAHLCWNHRVLCFRPPDTGG